MDATDTKPRRKTIQLIISDDITKNTIHDTGIFTYYMLVFGGCPCFFFPVSRLGVKVEEHKAETLQNWERVRGRPEVHYFEDGFPGRT